MALFLKWDLQSCQTKKAKNIVCTSLKMNLFKGVTIVTIVEAVTASVISSFKFVLLSIITKKDWIN